MSQTFQIKMPREIICGANAVEALKEKAHSHKKAVIFTDKGVLQAGLVKEPARLLLEGGCEAAIFSDIPAEPSYTQVQQIADDFLQSGADLIVAVGGGSVMDTAKLASLAAEGETVKDYIEQPLLGKKRVKTIMIPTTAGTGSEATPNSIVLVPEQELKVGIVNPEMIADTVILDGNMIRNLPQKIAAATGMDALAHAIECFTSNKANDFSDMYALTALKLIFRYLVEACSDQENIEAKNKILLAAFYGGVAITASGTTAVHALSYPLGGKYHIAHGVSNAILLVPVMRFNKDVCEKELAEVYDAVGGEAAQTQGEKADWVIGKLEEMVWELGIPSSLKEFGVGTENLDELVDAGMKVTRLLNNNKKTVTREAARALYLEIM